MRCNLKFKWILLLNSGSLLYASSSTLSITASLSVSCTFLMKNRSWVQRSCRTSPKRTPQSDRGLPNCKKRKRGTSPRICTQLTSALASLIWKRAPCKRKQHSSPPADPAKGSAWFCWAQVEVQHEVRSKRSPRFGLPEYSKRHQVERGGRWNTENEIKTKQSTFEAIHAWPGLGSWWFE